MIRDRRSFEKYLISKGIDIKNLSFSYTDDYDIIIYRKDDIETLFLFGDKNDILISMSKKTSNLNDETMLNIINIDDRMHAYYKNDEIIVTMISPKINAEAFKLYKEGLLIMECF